MSPRVPQTMTLRAFEAAARNLSFTVAAQELNITQGAVSRQIRLLESLLGRPLFERFTRRIELTTVGRDYYLDIQQALLDIERATTRVVKSAARSVITISVLPTLGTSWLMPRLSGFVEKHPQFDVRLATSIDAANFHRTDMDVAIRVGRVPGDVYPAHSPRVDSVIVENWRGVRADYLLPDILLPVIATSQVGSGPPIQKPHDLLRYPLIHTLSRPHAWDHWLQAHGLVAPEEDRLTFGHYFMGLRAAEEGRGLAIIPSVLIPQESLATSLIAPLPSTLRSAGSYYLVCLETRADEPAIQAFREWILAETASWREGSLSKVS